jgi:hypothetical protein
LSPVALFGWALASLLLSVLPFLSFQRRDFREGAKPPLLLSLPLPFLREGGQGMGYIREAKSLFDPSL